MADVVYNIKGVDYDALMRDCAATAICVYVDRLDNKGIRQRVDLGLEDVLKLFKGAKTNHILMKRDSDYPFEDPDGNDRYAYYEAGGRTTDKKNDYILRIYMEIKDGDAVIEKNKLWSRAE